ncbi:MAG: ATP-dependent Clp protease proteolytic subunit [Planctomycetota bacterium]
MAVQAWRVSAAVAMASGLMASPAIADDLIAAANTGDTEATSAAQAPEEPEVDPIAEELERLRKENQLLKAEYELLAQRQKNELQEAELRRAELASEQSLEEAELKAELADMEREVKRLKAESALAAAREDERLREMKTRVDLLQTQARLADAERDAEMAELAAELAELQQHNAVLGERLKQEKLASQLAELETSAAISELNSARQLRDTKDTVMSVVLDDLEYRENPLDGDTLYISDRRIELNGPIYSGVSTYITDRIHYFNNLDREAPIFIVIDRSPGGSVMEGYRILEAMKNSDAPVHVVVKQFAASMAAFITTLADHSYAYPNAIMLHHQMSYGAGGNMTQQKEQLESAEEWARRLMEPLADKMGETPERVVELMYENASTGDWDEFADVAVELNWVDNIVTEIREEGLREKPKAASRPFFFFFGAEERTDTDGERFIQLPEPAPFDFYYMYNPDRRYRW